jgi:YD repeat-containing protein
MAVFTVLLVLCAAVPVFADPSSQPPPDSSQLGDAEVAPPPGAEAQPALPEEGEVAVGTDESGSIAEVPLELQREPELETPWAIAERQESKLAYADLNPAEEKGLLEQTFEQQLEAISEDPSRMLENATLEQIESPTEALATVEGQPTLIESSVPLRATDSEGKLSKVDLGLEETEHGYAAVNPLVDVQLPQSAAGEIGVGDKGLTLRLQGASSKVKASTTGEGAVFAPEAGEDTSLLMAPISGGLELSAMLSSRESPEQLVFEATLPAGAQLRSASDGGAEVVSPDEEVLYRISAPRALDAQGTAVPATMAVKGEEIILQIQHRQMDVAYPIYLDPEITENWTNFTDTSKLNYWNWQYSGVGAEDYIGWRSPIVDNWGNGLYLRSRSSFTYPAGSYGRWWLGAPNSTAYFDYVNLTNLHFDAHGCTANEPHGYIGVWNDGGYWSAIATAYPSSWYGFASSLSGGSRTIFLGMTAASKSNISCGRDYALNGAVLYLTDPENPTVSAPSGIPSGWIKAGQTFTATLPVSDPGLGVKSATLSSHAGPNEKLQGCSGHYGSTCPSSYNFQWTGLGGGDFGEGERTSYFKGEDALGNSSTEQAVTTKVDLTSPLIELSGQLAKATKEEGNETVEEHDPTAFDALPLSVYNLTINATDIGKPSEEAAKRKRSGVKKIEVFLDKSETPLQTTTQPGSPSSCDSCPLSATYTLKLNELSADKHHTLKVLATDYAGNEAGKREIGFEYVPATGEKDEYLLQHFKLFDPEAEPEEGVEATGPELAVNLMNGNLVFHQQDLEVPGPAANLEVERFYNSLLPEDQDSEFGDGWTLAQTPTLEPEEVKSGSPTEAALLEESGGVESSVTLPTKTGEEEFEPGLGATITKEAGGYSLTDESGEGAPGVLHFDESGEATELETGEYSGVEYNREGGELSEIAVEDTASAGLGTPPKEPEWPTESTLAYSATIGTSGTGKLNGPRGVATDGKGHVWVVDRANNRVVEFSETGTYISAFGKAGAGNGEFNNPWGIAFSEGHLWVADTGNYRVQEFNEKGEFLQKFGSKASGSSKGTEFLSPEGIAVTPGGMLWVSDSGGARLAEFRQSVTSESERWVRNTSGATLVEPVGVAVDASGNAFVADEEESKVFEFDPEGKFVRSIGSFGTGTGQLRYPTGVAIRPSGTVLVVDAGNSRIEEFSPEGTYLRAFGSSGSGGANFNEPKGIAIGSDGSAFVADKLNNALKKWMPLEFAYSATIGTSGTGKLNGPRGVASDGKGHVWVVDRANNRVVEFSETGTYLGQFGSAGSGSGQFNNPWGITYSEGTLWVADTGNYRVQQFNTEGKFLQKFGTKATTTSKGTEFLSPEGIAATGSMLWVSDSGGARLAEFRQTVSSESERWVRNTSGATLNEPEGVAVDAAGDVLVADEEEGKVLVFSPEGTYIRSIGSFGTAAGQLRWPTGIAIRPSGTILVVDAGNNRVEEFSPEGAYLRSWGSAGSGGANFSEPKGVAIGSDGSAFVADKANNALKKWGTALAEAEAWAATEGAKGEDPALQVDVAGGLVEEIEGESSEEEVAYDHEGQLLTDVDGPEGETHYAYDANKRMIKVELPNGSWAEIAYEATYGRVKSVTVSIEGATAKTTKFEYTDSPARSTRVVPPAPESASIYDIGADGSFVRWWNENKAPKLEGQGGTLYDSEHKETATPISPGTYSLEFKGFSTEGIAKLEIIANGSLQVDEKTCEENPEKFGVECERVSDQWVMETASWPAGILYLEMVATGQSGEEASERFWVNIPQPAPEEEAEEEAAPTYGEIKAFREEFGLDLDLKGNEEAINDRIFALERAWKNPQTPEGEVARATAERWGVPLRAVDAAELEDREAYLAHDVPIIEQWSAEHASSTYAGIYADEAAGGILHVGFTSNQSSRLAELQAISGLIVPHSRLAPYSSPPSTVHSLLESTDLAVEEGMGGSLSTVTTVEIDEKTNKVLVGASNVSKAESQLVAALGAEPPVVVTYEPSGGAFLTGRNRDQGRMLAGDRIVYEPVPEFVGDCTAGYGAYEDRDAKADGEPIRARFLLTAGHCAPLDEPFFRTAHAIGLREYWHEIGHVTRSSFLHGPWHTDALAIRLNDGLAPSGIYRTGHTPLPVETAGSGHVNEMVCFSGAHTDETKCRKILARRTFEESGWKGKMFVVPFGALHGDSGAPVWSATTKQPIGLISAEDPHHPLLTYVAPLRRIPGVSKEVAPGILRAPGLFKLGLILGEG